MIAYLPIIVFLGVPLVLTLLLRVNSAVIFFSICGSAILQQFLDPDATQLVNGLLPGNSIDFMSLGVVIVPLAIAVAMFVGTAKKAFLPLHVVLAILAGLTALLVADRFLPTALITSVSETIVYELAKDYQTVIVGFGILSALFLLKVGNGEKQHKKGKNH